MQMPDVHYQEMLDGVVSARLRGFFAGWPNPPTPETLLRLLASSDHIVLAIDPMTTDVIGYVTAITDGVLSAYVSSIEVLPRHQGRGIGTALMRRLLDRLEGLYMVDLVCDPEIVPFYERLGLQPATAMVRRDYAHQSGRS